MGFFQLLKPLDMNEGIKEWKESANGRLIDVRSKEEYAQAHVPDSLNIPLSAIVNTKQWISDLQTPLFVYCESGSRSRQAVAMLEKMGYQNVKNIGGISSYRGELE